MLQIDTLMSLLPDVYSRQLMPYHWKGLEEIRLGSGRPLLLRYHSYEQELYPQAEQKDVDLILQRACNFSVYAYMDTISKGFITVAGGHRIGICGFGVLADRKVQNIRTPSSVNIRVASEIVGCAESLYSQLQVSTLLLGPPGSGKTTLLRDTVRLLSDKRKVIVGLADERGELSAMVDGTSQLNVGSRTDVLVNIPKAEAVMMLLRTMNPVWIALDEITAREDMEAIEQAAYCGVKLIATAHGSDYSDLKKRPLYRSLMACGVFEQVVLMKKDKSYEVKEAIS